MSAPAISRSPRSSPGIPTTNAPFLGDVIPTARLDPAALAIQQQFVPTSNLPNNFFEVRRPDPLNTDEATLKLDHYISPTHNIAFSYFYLTGTDTQPLSLSGNIPWVDRDFKWNQHNVNVADTWTLSPTVINQFRVTFVRQFGGRVNNPTTSLGDLNSKFTIQGDPTLPRLSVSGYFTGQTSIAGPDAGSDYFSVKDTVSMSRGNHSFKFGGEVSYEEIVHDTLLDNYGVFAFNASKTGNAYADFLLGLPSTMTQDAPVRKTDNGAYISLFAQDDFRISSKVTLNLGLRYDLQFPYTDPQNRKLAYVPGEQSQVSPTAPIGLLFPGDPGISRGIVHTDYNNIAPRVGVAWDPRGDGRMSVRAAAGVFYGSITGNEWNTTADNQPFTVRQPFPTVKTLSDPYGNLPGGVGPFPFIYDPASPRFTLPAQVFGPSLDFVWPYSYQTNFTIEKEFFTHFAVTASYVGAFGRNLPASIDQNYPVFGPGATTANVNARRPYMPGVIGQARVLESIFKSDYNGMQLSAEHRGAAFTAKAYYTFGKGLEDVDYQGGGLPAVQNSNRIDLERARTSNDRRHSFVVSAVWRPDYFDGSKAIVKALLDDWTISSIVTLAERAAADDFVGYRPKLRRAHERSRRYHRRSETRQQPAARGTDRAVVQYGRLRAARDWAGWHGWPEHRRGAWLYERRSRRLPRHPARWPDHLSVPPRDHQRLQHRQSREPRHGPQRAGQLRKDPLRPRHAPDSARRAPVVLSWRRGTEITVFTA